MIIEMLIIIQLVNLRLMPIFWLKVGRVDNFSSPLYLQDLWHRDIKKEWLLMANIIHLSLIVAWYRVVAKLEWDFKVITHKWQERVSQIFNWVRSLILPFLQDRNHSLLVSRKRLCLLPLWPSDNLLQGQLSVSQVQVTFKTSTLRILQDSLT